MGAVAGVVVIAMIWCIKNTWDHEEQEYLLTLGEDLLSSQPPSMQVHSPAQRGGLA